jgi:hypothetical protein
MKKVDYNHFKKHMLDTEQATKKLKTGLGAGSIKGVVVGKEMVDGYLKDVETMSKKNIVSKYTKTGKSIYKNR